METDSRTITSDQSETLDNITVHLKDQVQSICEKLAAHGEESVFISTNRNDDTSSFRGSKFGQDFILNRLHIIDQFYHCCMGYSAGNGIEGGSRDSVGSENIDVDSIDSVPENNHVSVLKSNNIIQDRSETKEDFISMEEAIQPNNTEGNNIESECNAGEIVNDKNRTDLSVNMYISSVDDESKDSIEQEEAKNGGVVSVGCNSEKLRQSENRNKLIMINADTNVQNHESGTESDHTELEGSTKLVDGTDVNEDYLIPILSKKNIIVSPETRCLIKHSDNSVNKIMESNSPAISNLPEIEQSEDGDEISEMADPEMLTSSDEENNGQERDLSQSSTEQIDGKIKKQLDKSNSIEMDFVEGKNEENKNDNTKPLIKDTCIKTDSTINGNKTTGRKFEKHPMEHERSKTADASTNVEVTETVSSVKKSLGKSYVLARTTFNDVVAKGLKISKYTKMYILSDKMALQKTMTLKGNIKRSNGSEKTGRYSPWKLRNKSSKSSIVSKFRGDAIGSKVRKPAVIPNTYEKKSSENIGSSVSNTSSLTNDSAAKSKMCDTKSESGVARSASVVYPDGRVEQIPVEAVREPELDDNESASDAEGKIMTEGNKKSYLMYLRKKGRVKEKEDKKEEHLCNVCGKIYKYKKNLKDHMFKHSGEYPFSCPICGRHFPKKGPMQTHLNNHLEYKMFMCEFCGKCFASKGLLSEHGKVHREGKPYECTQCGKKFPRRTYLTKHMKFHKENKEHMCEECGKRFFTSSHLKRHYLIHSGIKQYQCNLCPYQCNQSGNLKIHMKVHRKEMD